MLFSSTFRNDTNTSHTYRENIERCTQIIMIIICQLQSHLCWSIDVFLSFSSVHRFSFSMRLDGSKYMNTSNRVFNIIWRLCCYLSLHHNFIFHFQVIELPCENLFEKKNCLYILHCYCCMEIVISRKLTNEWREEKKKLFKIKITNLFFFSHFISSFNLNIDFYCFLPNFEANFAILFPSDN